MREDDIRTLILLIIPGSWQAAASLPLLCAINKCLNLEKEGT